MNLKSKIKGMKYLHSVLNICHRDLKAGNIFLEQTGIKINARIGDFEYSINQVNNLLKNVLDIGTFGCAVSEAEKF